MIKKIINNKTGRKLLGDNIYIISGGIYGRLGDIIVDNFDSPKIIYGMADGRGQLIEKLTSSQSKQIKYVSNYFKINQHFSEIL